MPRIREPVRLRVPGETVGDVVARLRAERSRGGPRLTCREDGRVRITEASRSSPPAFRGQLRQDGADTVLDGEVRETLGGRFTDGLFIALTVFMAAVAVLLAVFDASDGVPGIVICGISALAFFGIVLAGRKLRGGAFAAQAELYRNLLAARLAIDPPMAADASLGEDDDPRVVARSLALYEKLHRGLPLGDCGAEVDALVDLIEEDGVPRAEARQAVEALTEEFGKVSPAEQAEVLDQLRGQQAS